LLSNQTDDCPQHPRGTDVMADKTPIEVFCCTARDINGQWWVVWKAEGFLEADTEVGRNKHPDSTLLEAVFQKGRQMVIAEVEK